MKYYKSITTGSIYRTFDVKYADGTTGKEINRYNWDEENWSGHIHSHVDTWKRLNEGIIIIPITKEQALQEIN
jgi:hypothetical protein